MIFQKFTRHFDANRMAMFLFAGYSAITTVGILLLAARITTIETTTRIIPFGADKEMVVSANGANAAYYKFWGMDIALAMGNLTPYNAKFVEKQVYPLVSSSAYPSVKAGIQSESAAELTNDVVTTFTPKDLYWQPQTGTVFVYGKMNQISPNGRYAGGYNKTYQMQMSIRNGLPHITAIELYSGSPHTLSWYKLHPITKGKS